MAREMPVSVSDIDYMIKRVNMKLIANSTIIIRIALGNTSLYGSAIERVLIEFVVFPP